MDVLSMPSSWQARVSSYQSSMSSLRTSQLSWG